MRHDAYLPDTGKKRHFLGPFSPSKILEVMDMRQQLHRLGQ
jgi:hypothetical protein